MASALSGLAQALLGGVQAGADSLAEQGREQQQVAIGEQQAARDLEDKRTLAEEKAAAEAAAAEKKAEQDSVAAELAHQRALELQSSKIAGEGAVKKEVAEIGATGRVEVAEIGAGSRVEVAQIANIGKLDVATLQTTTQTNIANQRDLIEKQKVKIGEARNDIEREKFEGQLKLGQRKLDQQTTYQTRLAEIADFKNTIAQEQNEFKRNQLESDLAFREKKFQQDKKLGDANLKLDEKRLELAGANSKLKKRRLEKEIEKLENNAYQGQKTEYDDYIKAKDATDKTVAAIDQIIANPEGLRAAAGFESNLITVGGTKAADFETALESFKGKLFTQVIQQMRGLGSLSDAEGKKIISSTKALSINMSDRALMQSLQELRGELAAAQERTNALAVPRPIRPQAQPRQQTTPSPAPAPIPGGDGGGDQDFSNLWQ